MQDCRYEKWLSNEAFYHNARIVVVVVIIKETRAVSQASLLLLRPMMVTDELVAFGSAYTRRRQLNHHQSFECEKVSTKTSPRA
jgi:hypothetical protein